MPWEKRDESDPKPGKTRLKCAIGAVEQSFPCSFAVAGVDLKADPLPPQIPAGNECCAAAEERVEHSVTDVTEEPDAAPGKLDREGSGKNENEQNVTH
jgi:hypothetical protein